MICRRLRNQHQVQNSNSRQDDHRNTSSDNDHNNSEQDSVESLCARISERDPSLTELKSRHVEDYDEPKLVALLEAAIASSSLPSPSLSAFYAEMDDMSEVGWDLLGRFASASASLEKLWIWNLRSGRGCSANHLTRFFRSADPTQTSIQGLGMEIQEPDQPLQASEREVIARFFAQNTSLSIVNILSETRFYSYPAVAAAATPPTTTDAVMMNSVTTDNDHDDHSESTIGSSFVDCVLTGLCQNESVSHLILRHSNAVFGSSVRIADSSVREFFCQNRSVQYLAMLVGNNTSLAAAIATSLRENCFDRQLHLHNMTEESSFAFLSNLSSVQSLEELTFVDCSLCGRERLLQVLTDGLQRCRTLKTVSVQLSAKTSSTSSVYSSFSSPSSSSLYQPMDGLLQSLSRGLEGNDHLESLTVIVQNGIMGPVGAHAVCNILSHRQEQQERPQSNSSKPLVRIELSTLSRDGAVVLKRNMPHRHQSNTTGTTGTSNKCVGTPNKKTSPGGATTSSPSTTSTTTTTTSCSSSNNSNNYSYDYNDYDSPLQLVETSKLRPSRR